MTRYIFELPMKVRDYECDLQGIVNNANYQHYTEHTRHEFLLSEGISFARLHEQGIDIPFNRLDVALLPNTDAPSVRKKSLSLHVGGQNNEEGKRS